MPKSARDRMQTRTERNCVTSVTRKPGLSSAVLLQLDTKIQLKLFLPPPPPHP